MIDNKTGTQDPVGLHTLEVVARADHFNRWMYDQIRNDLKGEILEIGSGIGNISKLVINDGHFITLSDYNENYCEKLKTEFSGSKNVREIIHIDLLHPHFEIQFKDYKERFDSIFLLNVIEHIEDDRLAVRNCSYLLKTGGNLILLAPAGSWLYCSFDKQLGHFRRYSLTSMKTLLTNENFKIKNASFFNATGIAGWFVFGKLLRKQILGENEMSVFNRIVPLAKMIDQLTGKKTGLSVIITGVK